MTVNQNVAFSGWQVEASTTLHVRPVFRSTRSLNVFVVKKFYFDNYFEYDNDMKKSKLEVGVKVAKIRSITHFLLLSMISHN